MKFVREHVFAGAGLAHDQHAKGAARHALQGGPHAFEDAHLGLRTGTRVHQRSRTCNELVGGATITGEDRHPGVGLHAHRFQCPHDNPCHIVGLGRRSPFDKKL